MGGNSFVSAVAASNEHFPTRLQIRHTLSFHFQNVRLFLPRRGLFCLFLRCKRPRWRVFSRQRPEHAAGHVGGQLVEAIFGETVAAISVSRGLLLVRVPPAQPRPPYLWGVVAADGGAERVMDQKVEGVAGPPGSPLVGEISDGPQHLFY